MYRSAVIGALREKLSSMDIQAMIIPSNDPHFGEYTQERYRTREWISGFNGSAGTLVITLQKAALWTDSRYFVQAAAQLQGSGIELMKMKMEGTPSISEWIVSQYPSVRNVAIDRNLFSQNGYTALAKELSPCNVVLADDFMDSLWSGREPLKANPVLYLDEIYSGEDTRSKHRRITSALGMEGEKYAYMVTMCDDVAWLCNIRGTDIEYNPLVQSYAVATQEKVHLFVQLQAVQEQVGEKLEAQGVELHPYGEFQSFVEQLPADTPRIGSKEKITVGDFALMISSGAQFIDDPVPGGAINYLKAIKNQVETEGFEKAFLADGVAWCKVLKFIDDSIREGNAITEYEVGEKFASFRSEDNNYRGESFEPIVAFGAAAALPHYSATKEHSQQIGSGNFLLMDTGGQYVCGTTDTTRTIPLGDLTEQQIRHYTLVLKGMVGLTLAKFPKGTRGCQLDILARGPLFSDAAMYFHGTGHGIGHYLCVHEGPQSIRMEENPVTLVPGMVLSNEPAVYLEGNYGIRTENVVQVQQWKRSEMNEFYSFRTFTLVPIDTTCVDWDLLGTVESAWVKEYNMNVYKKLAPLLDEETAQWLAGKCI